MQQAGLKNAPSTGFNGSQAYNVKFFGRIVVNFAWLQSNNG